MKRLFVILSMLLIASVAFGYVIKESKEGEGIQFITKDTGEGSPTKKGEISSDGTLVVEKIKNADGSQPEGGVPSGMIAPFGGSSAPTGWLLCDGSAVSRTTYANLFAAIGETWGAGDGSTTFNVPDLETDNRFLRSDGGSLSVGDTQSDATAKNGLDTSSSTVTINKNQWNDNQNNHSHTFIPRLMAKAAQGSYTSVNHPAYPDYSPTYQTGGSKASWNSANATGTAAAQSLSGDTETRPNSAVVKYIIKI